MMVARINRRKWRHPEVGILLLKLIPTPCDNKKKQQDLQEAGITGEPKRKKENSSLKR